MTLIIAAGLCSLIPPVYFVRLMADGQKLQKRVLERQSEFRENVQEQEKSLTVLDPLVIPEPGMLSSDPS